LQLFWMALPHRDSWHCKYQVSCPFCCLGCSKGSFKAWDLIKHFKTYYLQWGVFSLSPTWSWSTTPSLPSVTAWSVYYQHAPCHGNRDPHIMVLLLSKNMKITIFRTIMLPIVVCGCEN
jgi:hypothetical protein